MEASGFSRALGSPLKKGQLRTSAIAGNHQRAMRVLRPVLELWNDDETQNVRIPTGSLVPVRYEQLNMVDLINLKTVVNALPLAKAVICNSHSLV